MAEEKKFLDLEGVKVLWNQVNLNDYPNNEVLIAVLNAIDTTKLDKETFDTFYRLYNEVTKEDIENLFIDGGN